MSFARFILSEEEVPNGGGSPCSVCGIGTKSFLGADPKKLTNAFPLNETHENTYRRGFEFMTNDELWRKVMRGREETYACLECFEREFLTPYLESHPDDEHSPNDYGFYHILTTDLKPGIPTNQDGIGFLESASKLENEVPDGPLY